MQILKALVGGLIGGAVGWLLSDWLQSVSHLMAPWSLLLVGLGAGLGVRLLCGKDRNFATGAIAAVAAIVALLGISYVDSMRVLSSAPDASQPVVTEWSDDDMAEDDAETEPEAADDMEADDADDVESAEESSDDSADDADDTATDSQDDDAEDDAAEEAPAGDQQMLPPDLGPRNVGTSEPQQVDWRSLEVILHAVSALLAYLLGAGSGKPATSQPGAAETSEGEQPG